uniref:LAGLIDADG endonuclease n=1 Tax=Clavaria fumosa TaxID=264083 RepID=A0A7T3U546_9AGAR|nr:LAGLIDADG endonuclease [Clavaria fumosa]QPZ51073.1 LAGLIDADG endonuclease [Clavaria fumosa]
MTNQFRQIRFYSESAKLINSPINDYNLNPFFVTGFTDAEGSFWISLSKDKGFKTGWRVRLYFEIHIHEKDLALLEQIKKFFGVGYIFKKKDESVQFLVSSVKDLQIIKKHFEKYLLLTKKRSDFELWIKVLDLVQNKEHLTMVGLQKIVALRSSVNKGLTNELKKAFSSIVPVHKPNVNNIFICDPQWLTGSGEGMFFIKIIKSKAKTGVTVRLLFQLTQHSRDEQLMKSLIDYLEGGYVIKYKEALYYRIEKFSDIKKNYSIFW